MAAEELRRAPGPDGPAGSSSGPNGSLDALGENALKIILLGDSACGKSKLVERFLLNNYQSRQLSTYALTLFRHNATVAGESVEIDFWDTAGQERFNSMHPAYYHLAHACRPTRTCPIGTGSCESSDKGSQWSASGTRST